MYWFTGLLGIAAMAAPFVLRYSYDATALWSSLILGLMLVVASVFEGIARQTEHWEYWMAGIVGILAIAAPFVLGFGAITTALWTMVVVGAAAALASGYELLPGQKA